MEVTYDAEYVFKKHVKSLLGLSGLPHTHDIQWLTLLVDLAASGNSYEMASGNIHEYIC